MGVHCVGGIDPSSKKIVIVETRKTNTRKPFIHSVELLHDRIEDNQLEAFDFIVEFCMAVRERDGQSPNLYLEAPVMGGGGGSAMRPGATIPQAYVSGSIMAAAAQCRSPIQLVNNSTWKKRICGNGNIAKENIGPWVKENWPELYRKAPVVSAKQHQGKIPNNMPEQDTLDAGCISLFGWRHVELIERLKKRRAK